MIRSGLPISQALDILSEQPDDPKFSQVVARLAHFVDTGFLLSRAMAKFPQVFPVLYYRMVEVGESTGGLESSLEALANWSERDQKTKNQLKNAMVYPSIVLAVTAILTILLMTVFVPQVLDGMSDKEKLPAISKALLSVSLTFKEPGFWLICIAFVGLIFPVLKKFFTSPSGAEFLLKMPLIGKLLLFGSGARYALTLSTLLSNGVGLRRGLKLAAEACGSPLIAADSRRMLDGLSAGEHLSELYELRPQIYPNILIQMVKVGEETSNLSEMLEKTSKIMAEDTEYLLEALVAALEPAVMALVAVIVGTILVAVFSSIYTQLDSL